MQPNDQPQDIEYLGTIPAELGTYMNNSSTVGPIRDAPPQREFGRRQPVKQKFRIVAPGSSARNTKKSPPAGFQKNAQGFITGSSMNLAPTPPFHGQITADQQRQTVPTQLVKPGTSTVNSSTVGPIRNAPQLQWVPIEPKFRLVKGDPLTGPITSSAPTPVVHYPVTADTPRQLPPLSVVPPPKSNALENPSNLVEVNKAPRHQLNQFDGFYNQVQKQLNSSQVTMEQQGLKRVFHLPYNGPVKVERSAYDELFDPNFKPVQTIINYKSEPAAEIQTVVKQSKNKKKESKKEEKKVVEEPKEIEEELEEGPIAALEYEDPVEQLEFENYVKSVAEEHGDEFLGKLLFDLIPGLRLDFNGHIARK